MILGGICQRVRGLYAASANPLNGPVVSPTGRSYHFPDLQITASQRHPHEVPKYLQERSVLVPLVQDRFCSVLVGCAEFCRSLGTGKFVGRWCRRVGWTCRLVQGIYWLLLGYGTAFLGVRYFWIQWRNSKISDRNQQRQARARQLEGG